MFIVCSDIQCVDIMICRIRYEVSNENTGFDLQCKRNVRGESLIFDFFLSLSFTLMSPVHTKTQFPPVPRVQLLSVLH